MSQSSSKSQDCKVCLVAHDEEIHLATLNVRLWFCGRVTKNFAREDEYIGYQEEQPSESAA